MRCAACLPGETPGDTWAYVMYYWDLFPQRNFASVRSTLPAFDLYALKYN